MRFVCLPDPSKDISDLPHQTISQWKEEAKKFGHLYTQRFLKEKVTTYIHIFVYHLLDYTEKLRSIEPFGNYVIESRHRILKTANNCFKEPSLQCKRWLVMGQVAAATRFEKRADLEKRVDENGEVEKEKSKKRGRPPKPPKKHWAEETLEEKKTRRLEKEKRRKQKTTNHHQNQLLNLI
jgi:hypothetical protein